MIPWAVSRQMTKAVTAPTGRTRWARAGRLGMEQGERVCSVNGELGGESERQRSAGGQPQIGSRIDAWARATQRSEDVAELAFPWTGEVFNGVGSKRKESNEASQIFLTAIPFPQALQWQRKSIRQVHLRLQWCRRNHVTRNRGRAF